MGVWAFFCLPSSPTECGFLTEREKAIALERVRGNKTGTEAWKFNMSQLKESFLDIRFYIIFILLVCTGLPNGGITAFGPEIIRNFGFTTLQSTLLNVGSGTCTVVGTGLAWYVSRWTGRTIAGVYTLCLAAVGCISELCSVYVRCKVAQLICLTDTSDVDHPCLKQWWTLRRLHPDLAIPHLRALHHLLHDQLLQWNHQEGSNWRCLSDRVS